MSRLSDTTFPNPFFLAVKMRCITSMDIKIFTIDVAGQCAVAVPGQGGCKVNKGSFFNLVISIREAEYCIIS